MLILSPPPNKASHMLVCVLDTNVLLANLSRLSALLHDPPQDQVPLDVVLLVPFVVVEELDHLKDSDRVCTLPDGQRIQVAALARRAARYIYLVL